MTTLHIEQDVVDYDKFKQMFDKDPADRRAGGVTSYRILRATDKPNHVMIDLEFNDKGRAEAFLGRLREVWARPDAKALFVGGAPQASVAETADSKKL